MRDWQWGVDLVAALLVLVLLYAIWLILRRRVISRHGGTFEFSVRLRPPSSNGSGGGWVLGVARYSGDLLEWFRIFSIRPRPAMSWERSTLTFDGRRDPEGAELYSLYEGHVIARCHTDAGPLEVAMDPGALTGFLAWLEAAPPGQQLRAR